MRYVLTLTAAASLALASCSHADRQNPLIAESFGTPYEIPPFEEITYDDYLPAIELGIAQQQAAVDSIVNNPEAPTFENTVLALDNSSDLLTRTTLIFSALDEADNTPELMALSDKIYPMLSAHSDAIYMNDGLFQRVKTIYDNIDSLDLGIPEKRMIADLYRTFARNGALLSDTDKQKLKEINANLTDYYNVFNKNLLAATNAFEIVVDDESRLAGLPASSIAVAAEEAADRGYGEEKWVFTLHAPSRLPLLQYAEDRDLREQMYKG
ncbi:MAG: peptidase M3, partial [Muribaculaceae bacterium]|nr:peptidase M3 [Muribaculaceae bacterium]